MASKNKPFFEIGGIKTKNISHHLKYECLHFSCQGIKVSKVKFLFSLFTRNLPKCKMSLEG